MAKYLKGYEIPGQSYKNRQSQPCHGVTLYCGKRQDRNKIVSNTDKYLDLRVAEGGMGLGGYFQGMVKKA